MTSPVVVVVGQLARDIVLSVPAMPAGGAAADVTSRRETLGGKGANQAVAVAQLGARVALVAVAGDDVIGDQLLGRAARDGVEVSCVVRRPGTLTGLIVEALEDDGTWRYLQHLPEPVLLTAGDVDHAADLLRHAGAVMVQAQQPPAAVGRALRHAREGGALVVLDGVPEPGHLALADVVRADEQEARLLGGSADDVLAAGPGMVAFGAPNGNLFAWKDRRWGEGELFLPLGDGPVVDTTGGGDSFTAALTIALLLGETPPEAARRAVQASAATVRHPGGRPDLRGV
ncbi:PfkB family carbohydrate kinase [Actinoplanes sp. CA-030573]|uniref:PfkB family carbohydrate kinase n=1 Tax=Actinoplanes sp. CA-030573 TaxID=3239898 RepID=UPI003D92ADCC